MGLDLKVLDLNPGLKGWYSSGLRFLLRPERDHGEPGDAPLEASSAETPFPEPWSRIYNSRSCRCTSVWTYWQLPIDLGPQASVERKRLFQNIVSALNWPQEHLVFWPLSAIKSEGLLPRTDLFLQGILLMKPLYILCFGDQAFASLFPENSKEYGLFKLDQINYIYLPGPEDMLPDNKQAKRIVWSTLKNL